MAYTLDEMITFEDRFLSSSRYSSDKSPQGKYSNGDIHSPEDHDDESDVFASPASDYRKPFNLDVNAITCPETRSRLQSLNRDLLMQGFTTIINNKGVINLDDLANCMENLLQKCQMSQRVKEEMENRYHRLECDHMHLQQLQNHLKSSLQQYEREIAKLELKEQKLVEKNRALQKRLKSERDEVKRLQSVIQHRDGQHKHASKKSEREHLKLKDRIHQLLSDRVDRKAGIHISAALQKSDKKRGTWKTGSKQEEEIYRTVISNYEDRQKELMVENSELRNGLKQLQQDLITLLNSPTDSSQKKLNDSDISVPYGDVHNQDDSPSDSLSDAHFQMPYSVVRDDILEDIRSKCKLLKDVVNSGSTDKENLDNSSNNFETKQLKDQIFKYQEIVDQQEKLLQQSLSLQNESPRSNGSCFADADICKDRDDLEEERVRFEEQRSHFEDERQNFTDAAIRLSRERKAFDEERASFLQRQFLNLTPFASENKQSRRAQSAVYSQQKNRRVLPSTPAVSDPPLVPGGGGKDVTPPTAAQPRLDTPSTGDLYQKLGLVDSPSPRAKLGQKSGGSDGTEVFYSPNSASPSGYPHQHRIVQHIDGIRMNLFDPMAGNNYDNNS